ncbi:MAG: hypothetical protein ACK5DJ_05085 [Bacteroidota bacterium]
MVGLVFWFHVILSDDTAKRTVSQTFAASISMQSDDASQVFRKFDSDLKYEWKTEKLQLEMADEFGISLYHGGVAYRHRDRFVFRFAAQTSRKKIASSTSLAMEGPLFPKRELLIDQNRGNYLSASKGGFLNPSQLSLNSGIRFIVFKGASLDVSIPSLMLNRLYDMGSKPSTLQRELLTGKRSVVYFATGATAIFNLSKPLSKSIAMESRSLLFLNGYRFKYQQWNQELRIAWMMRKNMEWVLQARFSEDRTVAPKVLKWYSLRLGYRLGRVK